MIEVTYQMVLSTLQTAGILVGIFYYIITLRNAQHTRELQLKAQEQAADTRKAQLLMQYNEKMSRPDIIEARVSYEEADWATPEDFIEDFSSLEGRKMIGATLGYFEGYGVLIKEGVIDIRPIALLSSGLIRSMWSKFEPVKDDVRKRLGWSRLFIEFEYLYNELMKFHKENPEVPL